jgi:hypothetical protein
MQVVLLGATREIKKKAMASPCPLMLQARAPSIAFGRWCRIRGTDPLPPSPEMIGLYLADLAAPAGETPAITVTTIERRLSGLA